VKRIILALTALAGILFLTACEREEVVQRVSATGFVADWWGEIIIFYMDDDRNNSQRHYTALAEGALEYVRYLGGIFDRFREGTDLWRLNHAGGEFVEVSPYLVEALEYSIFFRDATNGRMDITIGGVRDLWVFEANPAEGIDIRIPTQAELSQVLSTVGTNIIIDGNRVRLEHPEASLDLGGIAKGYMADLAADFLRERGVEHAIINLGGDNMTIGGRPDGMPFGIGLPAPGTIGLVDGHIGVALIESQSMVGSGVDQRAFWRDGVRYHHILDVDTGMPVDTDMLSVFIISESAILGEGLSTAMYTMGREAGMALVEGIPNAYAVLFVDVGREGEFEVQTTSGVTFIPPGEDGRFMLYFN